MSQGNIHPLEPDRALEDDLSDPAECQARVANEALLVRIGALLDCADVTQAAALIKSVPVDGQRDGDTCVRLGHLAERAGDLDRALREYERALSHEPASAPALRSIAALLVDRGEPDRAIAYLERLVASHPDDVDALVELGRQREASGDLTGALELYQRAAETEGPLEPLPSLEVATRAAPVQRNHDVEGAANEPFATADDRHAVMLSELFAGREGVHARQWRGEKGKAGYSPVHEPFTPAIARQHLLGTYTVGVYVVRLDNTSSFLCVDVDLTKEAIASTGGSRDKLDELLNLTHAVAREAHQTLASVSLPAYIEDSGKKGRHVWVCFERPVSAGLARRLGRAVLRSLTNVDPRVSLEVFPRQARVPAGALGNLVKVPLGVHRGTGRRSVFLTADGRPVADSLALLDSIERPSAERVLEALEKLGDSSGPDLDPDDDDGSSGDAHLPSRARRRAPPSDNDAQQTPGGVPSAQAQFESRYLLGEDADVQRVLAGCAVLADIVRRAEVERVITPEEGTVVTYTIGCLPMGAQAVNAILSNIQGLPDHLRLSRRLRGNPTSCQRIRNRLPDLAERSGCPCGVVPKPLGYPTPVAHGSASVLEGARLMLDRLVADYLRARQDLARAQRIAHALGKQIADLMETEGLSQLETSVGTLRAPNGPDQMLLELAPSQGAA